ncbi:hypothetical protein BWI93_04535 [Siphonobacter sp. BAB-5385]|uniref:hypothetical protein n=1 Tax=Siphonobacter sp. BAB-5385 TaxID=1864822 RepID=UPI000B9E1B18|nr:hypothetical protein [Siphonobacter sp. BAB-5385]OZI09331.1 hypothetical protein BWI93_04535 [Siphonobacter sp. BAB-5385]
MTTEQLKQAKSLEFKITSLEEILKKVYAKNYTGYTLRYRGDTMSSTGYTHDIPRDEVLEQRIFEIIRDRIHDLKQEFASI